MTFGTKTTSMSTYLLEKKLTSAKIEIKYWKDLKTVEVPFKIEARVGL